MAVKKNTNAVHLPVANLAVIRRKMCLEKLPMMLPNMSRKEITIASTDIDKGQTPVFDQLIIRIIHVSVVCQNALKFVSIAKRIISWQRGISSCIKRRSARNQCNICNGKWNTIYSKEYVKKEDEQSHLAVTSNQIK